MDTHSKSECFGSVTSCKANERRRYGQIGHHLGHTQRHGQDDGTPQRESDEKTGRSAIEQTASDLDVQCRANGAADTAPRVSVRSSGLSSPKRRFYKPDELDVPRFQFPVSVIVQTGRVHGFRAMALGVVVVGRKVEVGSFARALFLFDVFGAAAAVACCLRGDAVVLAVGHGDGCD